MTEKERINRWKQSKKDLGWRGIYMFGPPELVKLIKEVQRKWKYENPQHYKQT